MQSDYGDFVLVKIETGEDFWCLIKALQDDNSSFMNNINAIVEQYKDGNLFGMRVAETRSMYKRGAQKDHIFCRTMSGGELSWYLLPCFCTRVRATAEICWVHSKFRRMGLGRALVSLLKIEYAFYPFQESLPFWRACNIKAINTVAEAKAHMSSS